MPASALLSQLFHYKRWANLEILNALESFDSSRHSEKGHTAIRILNHTHVVDRIFSSNLQLIPHSYRATNTQGTPELEALGSAIRETDDWYITYVDNLEAKDLSELVEFTFTDGSAGRMSREAILMHVVNHGSYHRGAIGRILTEASIAPPRDTFARYLSEL